MISTVRGEFGKTEAKVVIDEADITKSTVEATIDVASINTRDEKRDAHLKSPDFFDVAKFPTMTFKSTKVEKAGEGLKVTGDLTMHGVTKPVVLDVTGPSQVIKDPWGLSRRGVSATTKVNRKDFGVSYGPDAMVSDLGHRHHRRRAGEGRRRRPRSSRPTSCRPAARPPEAPVDRAVSCPCREVPGSCPPRDRGTPTSRALAGARR